MSYSYDRSAADKVPAAIVPVTRFFGRNRGAYAQFLEQKTGMSWEASDWTGKEFGGTVAFRFYAKSNPEAPNERIAIEIKVSPMTMFGDNPDGLVNVSVGAERQGRTLAWKRHDKVKSEIFKHPNEVFGEEFFGHLMPSLHGDYSRELGEVQEAMKSIVESHKELDTLLAEVDRLVKEDPVANYEAIEKAAREASYAADSVERGLSNLPSRIEIIVKRK